MNLLDARVEAVLFDLDGTLVDSAAMTAAAIIETLASFGGSVTVEQIRANGGRPLRSWFTAQLALAPELAEAAYWRYVEQPAGSLYAAGATHVFGSLHVIETLLSTELTSHGAR